MLRRPRSWFVTIPCPLLFISASHQIARLIVMPVFIQNRQIPSRVQSCQSGVATCYQHYQSSRVASEKVSETDSNASSHDHARGLRTTQFILTSALKAPKCRLVFKPTITSWNCIQCDVGAPRWGNQRQFIHFGQKGWTKKKIPKLNFVACFRRHGNSRIGLLEFRGDEIVLHLCHANRAEMPNFTRDAKLSWGSRLVIFGISRNCESPRGGKKNINGTSCNVRINWVVPGSLNYTTNERGT